MPNSKELELERQALLLDMAGKIDVIYSILSAASISQVEEEPVQEKKVNGRLARKLRKMTNFEPHAKGIIISLVILTATCLVTVGDLKKVLALLLR